MTKSLLALTYLGIMGVAAMIITSIITAILSSLPMVLP